MTTATIDCPPRPIAMGIAQHGVGGSTEALPGGPPRAAMSGNRSSGLLQRGTLAAVSWIGLPSPSARALRHLEFLDLALPGGGQPASAAAAPGLPAHTLANDPGKRLMQAAIPADPRESGASAPELLAPLGQHSSAPGKLAASGPYKYSAATREVLGNVLEALGRGCDGVYNGINSIGRAVKSACVAVGKALSPAESAHTVPAKPIMDPAQLGKPTVFASELLSKSADSLSVFNEFKGEKLTYDNFLYLIEDKSYRTQADREGIGMNAPVVRESSPLARRLTSISWSARDPWDRLQQAFGQSPEANEQRAAYQAYRKARFPDFDNALERASVLSAPQSIAALKAEVEQQRALLGDAYDADARVAELAQQFSRDAAVILECTAGMAAYLKAL